MAVIPRKIYRTVEWQLHNAARTRQILRDAWQDVLEDALPGCSIAQASNGGTGDRTASAAIRLSERSLKAEQLEAWIRCIQDTAAHFADTVTCQVAQAYYGSGKTILQVAEELHYEKQTINRYRDRYVSYLALLAASRGLIDMGNEGWPLDARRISE